MKTYFLIPVMLLTLLTDKSYSQIVNVLGQIDRIPAGISGSGSLPLQLRKGNPDIFQIGGDAVLGYKKSDYLVLLILDGEYGSKDYEDYLSKYFSHVRFRKAIKPKLDYELFFQYLHNKFSRISSRNLGGIGLRYSLINLKENNMFAALSYMAENEQVLDGDIEFVNRLSTYVQYYYSKNNDFVVSETLFIQPAIDNSEDIRFLNEMYLKINEGAFFIKNSLNVTYDSRVPDEVDSWQTVLKSSIGVDF